MRLLVFDAKKDDAFVNALRKENIVADQLGEDADSDDVFFAARHGDYDALIFVVNNKPSDWLNVWYEKTIKNWRQAKLETPIVVMLPLARTYSAGTPKLLDAGADVVFERPIAPSIMLAQIAAIRRRVNGRASDQIEFGDGFVLDLAAERLSYGETLIHLSKSQFVLLKLLCEQIGRVVTRDQMLATLYQHDGDEPNMKILDVFLYHLRRGLKAACGRDGIIETSWGRGYVIRKSSLTNLPSINVRAQINGDARQN